MSEINEFADYWKDLVEILETLCQLEEQNEKLLSANEELMVQVEELQGEVDELKKQLDKREKKIKTLNDSERRLKLAQNKVWQANKTSEEAKIQMKKIDHLKLIVENLISAYHQKNLELQEKLNDIDNRGGDNTE